MDQRYELPPFLWETPSLSIMAAGSWAIPSTFIDAIRSKGGKGQGQPIAVLDTGAQKNHPWLKSKYTHIWSNVPDETSGEASHPHGPHCSGTAAGLKSDIGFATDAPLMSGQVLSSQGSGFDSWIMGGMERSAKNGAKFISLSIGGGGYNEAFDKLGLELTQSGIIIVVASGNERQSGGKTTYPARYPWALRVGAIAQNGKYAPYSNPGQDRNTLTLGFPGDQILSVGPNGTEMLMSGTSMACPGVTGALACVQSYRVDVLKLPPWTAEDFRANLINMAADIGTPGLDVDYGPGLFDGRLVMNMLQADPPPIAA